MSTNEHETSSRREFLQNAGRVAAATAVAGMVVPHVHAAENNTIQVALIGCGGRGTGAAKNALSVKNGPIKLVAMADVFPKRLEASYNGLQAPELAPKVDVPKERQFIGFDGYKKAMDCLKEGDVAILATPPAFRWPHFTYAIEKGINVFMEKPISVDGPSSQKMFKLGEESVKKNLKVGVGLMCRHCKARQALHERIQNGDIGDILLLRAYRLQPAMGFTPDDRPKDMSELLWQISKFHSFLWASGGAYSDYLIHNLDEACWMKNDWPIEAVGLGGRHYRGDAVDQNFDTYSIEYTFKDGAKLLLEGRSMTGCLNEFASYAHGTKGSAIISTASHVPAKSRIYQGQNLKKKNYLTWEFPQPEPDPYQVEWDDLIDAIRNDKPYNEVKRGVEASLVTAMGRMAAHTGRKITYDEMIECDHEFAPDVANFTMDSLAPLQKSNRTGKYSVPQPGITSEREYG
jgi:predicted dehydrogenase